MAGRIHKPAQPSTSGVVTQLHDPTRSELTDRQRAILSMIRETTAQRGYPPSVREIGESVGLTSPSSVAHQLKNLQRAGYLRIDPNRPRALVLAPDTNSNGDITLLHQDSPSTLGLAFESITITNSKLTILKVNIAEAT